MNALIANIIGTAVLFILGFLALKDMKTGWLELAIIIGLGVVAEAYRALVARAFDKRKED